MLTLHIYEEKHAAGYVRDADGHSTYVSAPHFKPQPLANPDNQEFFDRVKSKGHAVGHTEFGDYIYRRSDQVFENYGQVQSFLEEKKDAYYAKLHRIHLKMFARDATPEVVERMLRAARKEDYSILGNFIDARQFVLPMIADHAPKATHRQRLRASAMLKRLTA